MTIFEETKAPISGSAKSNVDPWAEKHIVCFFCRFCLASSIVISLLRAPVSSTRLTIAEVCRDSVWIHNWCSLAGPFISINKPPFGACQITWPERQENSNLFTPRWCFSSLKNKLNIYNQGWQLRAVVGHHEVTRRQAVQSTEAIKHWCTLYLPYYHNLTTRYAYSAILFIATLSVPNRRIY